MIRKEFEYKGQQINYLNKIKKSNNIEFAWGYLDAKNKCYVIEYAYKKKS